MSSDRQDSARAQPSASNLPIEDVIPSILQSLRSENRLVIAAPPGAGKTTRVPLALLSEDWVGAGRILLLEPRRIAARAAAERMAQTLGEFVGGRVGLRARMDVRLSRQTQLEVLTEGVFTRLILDDPELSGVSAVIFDEFHERSLDADVGFALALETQAVLRPELRLLVMSATLDVARISKHLQAPIVESQGRAFPVETLYLGRSKDQPVEADTARAVRRALKEQSGSILVFLPGAAEINRTAERLTREGLPDDIILAPLYGALGPAEQDQAIRPAPQGRRKVVLASDIAESALTIEGVRVVIDAGLARVPRFDAQAGVSRLETLRASRANIDQRRGRAGRTAPGVCYRLWDEPETRGLAAEPRPEILESELSGLALDLAVWGSLPEALGFLDPPPPGVFAAGQAVLRELGALDDEARLTAFGKRLAALPLPPRLGAMVLRAAQAGQASGSLAAELSVLISERGLGGRATHLGERLTGWRRERATRAEAARGLARRWAEVAAPFGSETRAMSEGAVLALGFPDRVARRRGPQQPGRGANYLMANGKGVVLPPDDPLAVEEWLVIADVTGGGADLRIAAACPLSEAEALASQPLVQAEQAIFEVASRTVRARHITRLGAILVKDVPLAYPSRATVEGALFAALSKEGLSLLPGAEALTRLSARAAFATAQGAKGLEPLTAAALSEDAPDWLGGLLANRRSFAELEAGAVIEAALDRLEWSVRESLDKIAPRSWTAPTGRVVSIDYVDDNAPLAEIKVQEVFGLDQHPVLGPQRIPVMLALLSPAQRPVALTRDLPGFWRGGYRDMRKDMRGRYPKHDWPDEPWAALAQTGAKRRPV